MTSPSECSTDQSGGSSGSRLTSPGGGQMGQAVIANALRAISTPSPPPGLSLFDDISLAFSSAGSLGIFDHHSMSLPAGHEQVKSLLSCVGKSPLTTRSSGDSPLSSGELVGSESLNCPMCYKPFVEPKVLACFHSFCKPCLAASISNGGILNGVDGAFLPTSTADKIGCHICGLETQVCSGVGVDSLLHDFGLENLLAKQQQQQLQTIDSERSVGVVQNSNSTTQLIFGSPSSRGSSPIGVVMDEPPAVPVAAGDESSSPAEDEVEQQPKTAVCTGCKSGEPASAHCRDCGNFLCQNCVMAHQFMHCFEGHTVTALEELDKAELAKLISSPLPQQSASTLELTSAVAGEPNKPVVCFQHRSELLRYFCLSCNVPICRLCVEADHPKGQHNFEAIHEAAGAQLHKVEQLLNEARSKQGQFSDAQKAIEGGSQRLQRSFVKAKQDVENVTRTLVSLIEEQRRMVLADMEQLYTAKRSQLSLAEGEVSEAGQRLSQTLSFAGRLLAHSSPAQVLVFKQLLDTRIESLLHFQPQLQNLVGSSCDLEFHSPSAQAARTAIVNAFGFAKAGGAAPVPTSVRLNGAGGGMLAGRPASRVGGLQQHNSAAAMFLAGAGAHPAQQAFSDSNLLLPKHDFGGSSHSLGPFSPFSEPQGFPYEKWSSGGDAVTPLNFQAALQQIGGPTTFDLGATGDPGAQVVELTSRVTGGGLFPPRSQIKRLKMIYHCKFGEFGVMEGQFTEPSGVAVNGMGDIVVADTNNHRIQVFDKEGRFKFQFGECGKRDGQLLYPNRVAVSRLTGEIIVTERSPTHQIQVYNHHGQFVRKFGANILQHPRGVTVDSRNRIVVIECKVMRILIFDIYGNVLQKFSCSRYLEFPNGVCTNDRQEIFVSDNRAHCIKVFNYEGQFVRQVGGEGITNYPIGVGINQLCEVVVADNHNNFNLTVFLQDGTLVNALESKVKHAQCFDVALCDDGSVALASKDYRLYMYRYMSPPTPSPFL